MTGPLLGPDPGALKLAIRKPPSRIPPCHRVDSSSAERYRYRVTLAKRRPTFCLGRVLFKGTPGGAVTKVLLGHTERQLQSQTTGTIDHWQNEASERLTSCPHRSYGTFLKYCNAAFRWGRWFDCFQDEFGDARLGMVHSLPYIILTSNKGSRSSPCDASYGNSLPAYKLGTKEPY